jgi:DNA-binding transcriptional LysR family regulator
MPLELQQLRQVVALAEHGSFVRAAAALHISQPALSRSIQNVERHFGGKLFQRGAGGVVPTDIGRLYIERARDLLRLADEFDREAMTLGALRAGRVVVGSGPFPAESFLGPAIAGFVEKYPPVAVQLHVRDWDDLLRQLRARELDFFVAETSTLTQDPDLEVVPLPSPHAVHFVARAEHPLAARGSVAATEALAWPFAAPSRIPPRLLEPMLTAQRTAARRGADPQPFPAIQCNGLAPVKRILAISNVLSASILSCVRTELETGQLVLLGTEPWLRLQYGIVSLKGRPPTQAAERLREFVIEAERATSAEEAQLAANFAAGRPARGGRPRRPLHRRAGKP